MQELNNAPETIRKFEPILEGLSFNELIVLNRMTAERIRLIQKAGTLVSMSRFNVGEHVSWKGSDGATRTGVITRMHRKTVSVKTSETGYWNISPELLAKV